jgi:hypothetical protein
MDGHFTNRGQCYWVIDGDGGIERCGGTLVGDGWLEDSRGRWHRVDACDAHLGDLQDRPGPDGFPIRSWTATDSFGW